MEYVPTDPKVAALVGKVDAVFESLESTEAGSGYAGVSEEEEEQDDTCRIRFGTVEVLRICKKLRRLFA